MCQKALWQASASLDGLSIYLAKEAPCEISQPLPRISDQQCDPTSSASAASATSAWRAAAQSSSADNQPNSPACPPGSTEQSSAAGDRLKVLLFPVEAEVRYTLALHLNASRNGQGAVVPSAQPPAAGSAGFYNYRMGFVGSSRQFSLLQSVVVDVQQLEAQCFLDFRPFLRLHRTSVQPILDFIQASGMGAAGPGDHSLGGMGPIPSPSTSTPSHPAPHRLSSDDTAAGTIGNGGVAPSNAADVCRKSGRGKPTGGLRAPLPLIEQYSTSAGGDSGAWQWQHLAPKQVASFLDLLPLVGELSTLHVQVALGSLKLYVINDIFHQAASIARLNGQCLRVDLALRPPPRDFRVLALKHLTPPVHKAHRRCGNRSRDQPGVGDGGAGHSLSSSDMLAAAEAAAAERGGTPSSSNLLERARQFAASSSLMSGFLTASNSLSSMPTSTADTLARSPSSAAALGAGTPGDDRGGASDHSPPAQHQPSPSSATSPEAVGGAVSSSSSQHKLSSGDADTDTTRNATAGAGAGADMSEERNQLEVTCEVTLSVDYYNQRLIATEPLVEPFRLRLRHIAAQPSIIQQQQQQHGPVLLLLNSYVGVLPASLVPSHVRRYCSSAGLRSPVCAEDFLFAQFLSEFLHSAGPDFGLCYSSGTSTQRNETTAPSASTINVMKRLFTNQTQSAAMGEYVSSYDPSVGGAGEGAGEEAGSSKVGGGALAPKSLLVDVPDPLTVNLTMSLLEILFITAQAVSSLVALTSAGAGNNSQSNCAAKNRVGGGGGGGEGMAPASVGEDVVGAGVSMLGIRNDAGMPIRYWTQDADGAEEVPAACEVPLSVEYTHQFEGGQGRQGGDGRYSTARFINIAVNDLEQGQWRLLRDVPLEGVGTRLFTLDLARTFQQQQESPHPTSRSNSRPASRVGGSGAHSPPHSHLNLPPHPLQHRSADSLHSDDSSSSTAAQLDATVASPSTQNGSAMDEPAAGVTQVTAPSARFSHLHSVPAHEDESPSSASHARLASSLGPVAARRPSTRTGLGVGVGVGVERANSRSSTPLELGLPPSAPGRFFSTHMRSESQESATTESRAEGGDKGHSRNRQRDDAEAVAVPSIALELISRGGSKTLIVRSTMRLYNATKVSFRVQLVQGFRSVRRVPLWETFVPPGSGVPVPAYLCNVPNARFVVRPVLTMMPDNAGGCFWPPAFTKRPPPTAPQTSGSSSSSGGNHSRREEHWDPFCAEMAVPDIPGLSQHVKVYDRAAERLSSTTRAHNKGRGGGGRSGSGSTAALISVAGGDASYMSQYFSESEEYAEAIDASSGVLPSNGVQWRRKLLQQRGAVDTLSFNHWLDMNLDRQVSAPVGADAGAGGSVAGAYSPPPSSSQVTDADQDHKTSALAVFFGRRPAVPTAEQASELHARLVRAAQSMHCNVNVVSRGAPSNTHARSTESCMLRTLTLCAPVTVVNLTAGCIEVALTPQLPAAHAPRTNSSTKGSGGGGISSSSSSGRGGGNSLDTLLAMGSRLVSAVPQALLMPAESWDYFSAHAFQDICLALKFVDESATASVCSDRWSAAIVIPGCRRKPSDVTTYATEVPYRNGSSLAVQVEVADRNGERVVSVFVPHWIVTSSFLPVQYQHDSRFGLSSAGTGGGGSSGMSFSCNGKDGLAPDQLFEPPRARARQGGRGGFKCAFSTADYSGTPSSSTPSPAGSAAAVGGRRLAKPRGMGKSRGVDGVVLGPELPLRGLMDVLAPPPVGISRLSSLHPSTATGINAPSPSTTSTTSAAAAFGGMEASSLVPFFTRGGKADPTVSAGRDGTDAASPLSGRGAPSSAAAAASSAGMSMERPYRLMQCGHSNRERGTTALRLRVTHSGVWSAPFQPDVLGSSALEVHCSGRGAGAGLQQAAAAAHSSSSAGADGPDGGGGGDYDFGSGRGAGLGLGMGLSGRGDKVFSLGLMTVPAEPPFHRTNITLVVDRFVLTNTVGHALEVRQLGYDDAVFSLRSQEEVPLWWQPGPQQLQVRLARYGWSWSGRFTVDKGGEEVSIRLRNDFDSTVFFVLVQVVRQGPRSCVLFRGGEKFSPYRFENHTVQTFKIRQAGQAPCTNLLPYHWCGYAWDEPLAPHKFAIEVLKNPLRSQDDWGALGVFDFSRLGAIERRSGLLSEYLLLRVVAQGPTRVLQLCDRRILTRMEAHSLLPSLTPTLPNVSSSNSSSSASSTLHGSAGEGVGGAAVVHLIPLLQVTINIAQLGVSVVDHTPQELVFLSVTETNVSHLLYSSQQAVRVEVGRVQIDNQLWSTPFPSLLHPALPASATSSASASSAGAVIINKKFLAVSLKLDSKYEGVQYLPWLRVDVAPFDVNLDGTIIVRCVEAAAYAQELLELASAQYSQGGRARRYSVDPFAAATAAASASAPTTHVGPGTATSMHFLSDRGSTAQSLPDGSASTTRFTSLATSDGADVCVVGAGDPLQLPLPAGVIPAPMAAAEAAAAIGAGQAASMSHYDALDAVAFSAFSCSTPRRRDKLRPAQVGLVHSLVGELAPRRQLLRREELSTMAAGGAGGVGGMGHVSANHYRHHEQHMATMFMPHDPARRQAMGTTTLLTADKASQAVQLRRRQRLQQQRHTHRSAGPLKHTSLALTTRRGRASDSDEDGAHVCAEKRTGSSGGGGSGNGFDDQRSRFTDFTVRRVLRAVAPPAASAAVMAPGSKLYIEELGVSEIQMNLSFNPVIATDNGLGASSPGSTAGGGAGLGVAEATLLEAALHTILLAIGSTLAKIDNCPIRFRPYSLQHSFLSSQAFAQQLGAHYTVQALRQAYVVVLSSEVLGNPVRLLHSVAEGVGDLLCSSGEGLLTSPQAFVLGVLRGSSQLVRTVLASLCATAGSLASSLQVGLVALGVVDRYPLLLPPPPPPPPPPRSGKDGQEEAEAAAQAEAQAQAVRDRLSSLRRSQQVRPRTLWKGVQMGLAGALFDPINGLHADGIKGLFVGTAKGGFGLAARPLYSLLGSVAGCLEVLSGALDARFQRTHRHLQRARPPRFFNSPNLPLRAYSADENIGQELISRIHRGDYRHEGYLWHTTMGANAGLGLGLGSAEGATAVLVLTRMRLMLLTDSFDHAEMLWNCPLSNLLSLEIEYDPAPAASPVAAARVGAGVAPSGTTRVSSLQQADIDRLTADTPPATTAHEVHGMEGVEGREGMEGVEGREGKGSSEGGSGSAYLRNTLRHFKSPLRGAPVLHVYHIPLHHQHGAGSPNSRSNSSNNLAAMGSQPPSSSG